MSNVILLEGYLIKLISSNSNSSSPRIQTRPVPRQHDNNGGQRDDPASSRVKARGEGSGGWDGTHQDGDTCRVPAHCCSLYEGTGAAYSHSRLESPAPGTVRARRAGARPFGAAVAQSMPGMARTYGRPGAAGRGTAGARRGGVVLVPPAAGCAFAGAPARASGIQVAGLDQSPRRGGGPRETRSL